MESDIAIPGLLWSPSSQHHLQPSCSLDWSDSLYFMRNHTISTRRIFLHGSHRNKKEGNCQLGTCKWFFLNITPFITLRYCLINDFISILLSRSPGFDGCSPGFDGDVSPSEILIQQSAGICHWSWMRWAIILKFMGKSMVVWQQ